jgi:hypothetical protein
MPLSLRIQKTGRKGFIMDQVSKYMVAAIKDVGAEVSVKDAMKFFLSFRCLKKGEVIIFRCF